MNHASANNKIVIQKHGLSDHFETFHCHEGTDIDARGRARVNVRDEGPLLELKNQNLGKATITRKSKNSLPDGSRVTYTKYLMYHVALKAAGRPLPPPNGSDHASHLCHNARCIRPSHLVIENQALNQQRKGCPGILICSVCNHGWLLCTHSVIDHCLTFVTFNHCNPPPSVVMSIKILKDSSTLAYFIL